MNLNELMQRFEGLTICDEREKQENYLEMVVLTEQIGDWNSILTDILGDPIKPAGEKPTKEHLKMTKEYRGIETEQTLFSCEVQEQRIIAMFWPWSNGEYVTIKIMKE